MTGRRYAVLIAVYSVESTDVVYDVDVVSVALR
jgi:hypothetical protein